MILIIHNILAAVVGSLTFQGALTSCQHIDLRKIKGNIQCVHYSEKRRQGIHALRHKLEREHQVFPNQVDECPRFRVKKRRSYKVLESSVMKKDKELSVRIQKCHKPANVQD